MTSHVIGRDPMKYAAMNYWPIGRDLIIIGRDVAQTNRIAKNWSRCDYVYMASNHN